MTKENIRKKVLLFYNPNAGNGLFSSNLDKIIDRFQKSDMIVVPVRSYQGGNLDYVMSNMDQSEYRQIIAAGGDGTINICVNCMVKYNIDLPLTIFPAGTANDFAYYFDLPHDINGMLDIALGDNYTYADVGVVNGRCFVNVAAMGMLVDVSQKTDPNLKNTIGTLAYYLRGLQEVPNLKAIPLKVTSRQFTGDIKMYFMLVMNGMSAGGFKRISPDSDINDGMLNVLIFKEMPILELGPLALKVLMGNHEENKNVIAFKTDKLLLETDMEVGTDVDGEKGEKFPLQFEVLPRRLKIFTYMNDMKAPEGRIETKFESMLPHLKG